MDEFYTPVHVAADLLRLVTLKSVRTIADVCAGEGALLLAGSARFPHARVYAADISNRSARTVKAMFQDAIVSQCDVLDARSFRASKVCRVLRGELDLAVVNPPFSCRGGAVFHATLPDGAWVHCSRAGAVLATAISLLRVGGEAVAIMPASFRSSDKDRLLREALQRIGALTFHRSLHKRTFSGCSATAVLVHFLRRECAVGRAQQDRTHAVFQFESSGVRVVRGVVACSRPVGRGAATRPFLHSTGLHGASVDWERRRVSGLARTVIGPVILLARVGRPTPAKLTVAHLDRPVVLSDCVIALCFDSLSAAARAHRHLLDHWPVLEGGYEGTGAPFLSLQRLSTALVGLGFLPAEREPAAVLEPRPAIIRSVA